MDAQVWWSLEGEELVAAAAAAGVPLRVLPDREALYHDFASAMLAEIERAAAEDRPCRLIIPVGPRGQYPLFVALCHRRRPDLRRLHLFAMDEYLDWQGRYLPVDHPLSFRGFLHRELLASLDPALGFAAERLVFPDPLELDVYSARIAGLGGIDACFGGLGMRGHVAFNEPPTFPFTRVGTADYARSLTRIVPLAPETVAWNSLRAGGADLEAFPPLAVTAGLADIRAAARIRLYCDGGPAQAGALRRAIFAPPQVAWPVTLLRGHPDFILSCEPAVAAPPPC